jgi:hypothetical protein
MRMKETMIGPDKDHTINAINADGTLIHILHLQVPDLFGMTFLHYYSSAIIIQHEPLSPYSQTPPSQSITKMQLSFLLPALLTVFPRIRAEQIFTNRGTLSGLETQTEHNGELKEDTSTFFDQPPSLLMTQTFDPSYTGRYHSEVHIPNAYRHGDTRFYGFAFRLPPDWQFDPAQSYNLAQFIAPFGDSGCDDFMPSTMVWAEGTKLFTRLKSGSVCDQTTKEFPLDGVALTAGDWHRVVLGASWTSEAGKNGSLQVWFDGKQVLDQKGVATTVAEDVPFQFRVGLYANGWHDDKGMKGSQGFRQVFFDKVAIATTKDEADPEKW